jgi:hypothetical protein
MTQTVARLVEVTQVVNQDTLVMEIMVWLLSREGEKVEK